MKLISDSDRDLGWLIRFHHRRKVAKRLEESIQEDDLTIKLKITMYFPSFFIWEDKGLPEQELRVKMHIKRAEV